MSVRFDQLASIPGAIAITAAGVTFGVVLIVRGVRMWAEAIDDRPELEGERG